MRPPNPQLLLLKLLFCFLLASVSEYGTVDGKSLACFEPESVLEPWKMQQVACTQSAASQALRQTDHEDGTIVSTAAASTSAKGLLVHLDCRASDQSVCEGARAAMAIASRVITSVIDLSVPVSMNASLVAFCGQLGRCSTDNTTLLGGAAPSRTFLLTDTDGMTRSFPQALVRQRQDLSTAVSGSSLASFDIVAMFNIEGKWWFPTNNAPPIQPIQHDFLYVLLHEIMHGLGFTTAWNDYLNKSPEFLTPNPLPPSAANAPAVNGNDPLKFSGFFESSFDRYLVEMTTKKSLSLAVEKLNAFDGALPPRDFPNHPSFIDKFSKSQAASEARRILQLATTTNQIGFQPTDNGPPVIMETSLSKYAVGSSVMHVDYATYSSTEDCLMRYLQKPGVRLQEESQVKNSQGKKLFQPVGPNLQRILRTLGYRIRDRVEPVSLDSAASVSHALSWTVLLAALLSIILI